MNGSHQRHLEFIVEEDCVCTRHPHVSIQNAGFQDRIELENVLIESISRNTSLPTHSICVNGPN